MKAKLTCLIIAAICILGRPVFAQTTNLGNASSTAAEASHIVCAAACNIFDVTVTTGAAAGFFIVWNDTTAPANGAIAGGGGATAWSKCIQVAANSSTALNYTLLPLRMSTGAVLLYSTTGCYNFTASATASFDWRVK